MKRPAACDTSELERNNTQRICVDCRAILTSNAVSTDDPHHGMNCSQVRSRRFCGNWINRGCYAAKACPPVCKRLCPSLCATFDQTDCMGSISCLNVRPDTAGLKHFSKQLLQIECSDHGRLAWLLTAHRFYDAADNVAVVLLFAFSHEFTYTSLKELQKALEKADKGRSQARYGDEQHVDNFAKLRANPSGSAASHSGRRWLKDVLASAQQFKEFDKSVSVKDGWGPMGPVDLLDISPAVPWLLEGWQEVERAGHIRPGAPCTIASIVLVFNQVATLLHMMNSESSG